ncbi:histidine kinase [Xylanimonas allomyrinae]|uniref:Histidine kinase n=1 Tax=Xylanimonas allomyrinae TaxID=2509459 RepID=A0A4P6EQT0_9MICO|nr:histidine kinase [Xylanimonas allomyrinae]QAY63799.1 histidine kinase [Xylanimonas allomyrinae]
MDLARYVDDLQQRLAQAADLAGDDATRLVERLTAPLDAAVRLVLLDALSVAAGEISAELAPGTVDLRLRGGDPEFAVVAPPARPAGSAAPDAPPPVPPTDGDEGTTTRTTLRLPDHLKAQVESAAARDGVSVNTWLVRAVAAGLPGAAPQPATPTRPEQRGNRLTGWVR